MPFATGLPPKQSPVRDREYRRPVLHSNRKGWNWHSLKWDFESVRERLLARGGEVEVISKLLPLRGGNYNWGSGRARELSGGRGWR